VVASVSSHTETRAPRSAGDLALVDRHVDGPGEPARTRRTRARRVVVVRALVLADTLGLLSAYLLAMILYGPGEGHADNLPPAIEIAVLILLLPIWIVLGRVFGLYSRDDEHADHSNVDGFAGVFTMVTIGTWLFVAAAWLLEVAEPYMPKLFSFWIAAVVLVSLARAVARTVYRRSSDYVQTALILGADEIGQLVASKIRRHPEYGIKPIGFVDSVPFVAGDSPDSLKVIGEPADLTEIVDLHGVERVIVAFSQERLSSLVGDLRALRSRDVQVDLVPRFYDVVGPRAGFHTVEGLPLVSLAPGRLSRSGRFMKRSLDVLGSAVGLMVCSPLFAYAAIRIKLDSPGPVLFRQERVGLDGEPFRVAKFRTMYVASADCDEAAPLEDPLLAEEFNRNFKLRDDPRVTPCGRWLRRWSLDELPQLLNVLRGEMSLVGPRPVIPEEMAQRFDGAEALLAVKPGMTGYWQINGRSDADYDERVRLELSYVGNFSLGLDITILAKTVGVLVSRRGAC
jgi:exopolysaccharide biosynthesis polyprenyl glycosylphosphotransferase